MTIHPQSLRSMRTELSKLGSAPEERMSSARKKQMWKDAPIVIGSMGLGWGVGRTVGDAVAEKALKDPKTRAAVKKYGPAATALVGTGIGLALARQRSILKKRRDMAERKAEAKKTQDVR